MTYIFCSSGKSLLGIMPGYIYKQGYVVLIRRLGALVYEEVFPMKDLRIEILKYFENDDETEIVMITGKIDGP